MTAPGLTIDLPTATVTITAAFDISVDGTEATLHTREGTVVIDRQVADRFVAQVVAVQGNERAAAAIAS